MHGKSDWLNVKFQTTLTLALKININKANQELEIDVTGKQTFVAYRKSNIWNRYIFLLN